MKQSAIIKTLIVALASCHAFSDTVSSEGGTNTAEITSSAVSPSCMQWTPVGVCFWLECDMSCKIKTSVKVRHFIPEVVVSSYADTGSNPWQEVASMSSPMAGAEGGGGMIKTIEGKDNKAKFKNADVIGHPGGFIYQAAAGGGYTCESSTQPFYPYFLSTLDTIGWRFGIPEMVYPEAIMPGLREVGSMFTANMWGNIYPREGTLVQPDDFKSAAVTAQRAADITTRVGQAHVYTPIKGMARDGYWPPDQPVQENEPSTHTWQELYPNTSQSCGVFPDREMTTRSSSDGYAFALWRPYRCCKREGQLFLGSVGN